MRLTIYTSETILRNLLDNRHRESERKYPVWVNFINTAIADIKYRPNPFVDPEEKEEDSIKTFVRSYTQQASNLSIKEMTDEEIALMGQMERYEINHVGMGDLRKDILRARSIVILDISPVVAEYISNNYGIICHAFSTPPEESPLFYEGREIYSKKETYDRFLSARTHLLTKYPINPINSLILLDRYLMSYEGFQKDCPFRCEECTVVSDIKTCPKTTPNDGRDNIVAFLKQILPQTLNEDFHLLLIYEGIKHPILDEEGFIEQTKWINESIRDRVNRPYKIEIEIVSLTYYNYKKKNVGKINGHCMTHNRRIFSNYFVIRAEHSLT